MSLTVRALTGAELLNAVNDLARLRMIVFAQWPYLYDGDEAYEHDYLQEYMAMPDAVLIAAWDENRIVGVATASPMNGQKAEFRSPFDAHGIDTERLFYFGESVLLADYRGQGIGHAFFDQREAHARQCGATAASFAAVIRETDHPARPQNYVSLAAFWQKRGYEPVPGLITQLAWKEHGEVQESPKSMQYWMRQL